MYRESFPFFQANPDIVYLDSAATTQKPSVVIDALCDVYMNVANPGRGQYTSSQILYQQVQTVRTDIAQWLGVIPEDVSFTSGATDASHRIASAIVLSHLCDGDEILYCPYDHASFIEPWKHFVDVLDAKGIRVTLVPYGIRQTGTIDVGDIQKKITPRTRCVLVTHIHNVFGSDNDVHLLRNICGETCLIIADLSQSIGHMPISIPKLDVDAAFFSGHKMFGPFGSGVLVTNKKVRSLCTPLYVGGMSPGWSEAGSGDPYAILGLGCSVAYIRSIGEDTIHQYLQQLTQYAISALRTVPLVEFLPGLAYCPCVDGYGIVSFRISGISSADVGFYLSQQHIHVRTGDACMEKNSEYGDIVRISMHIYNTTDDVDALVRALRAI